MFTTDSKNEVYTAPVCCFVTMNVQTVVCTSPVPGEAGPDDVVVNYTDEF